MQVRTPSSRRRRGARLALALPALALLGPMTGAQDAGAAAPATVRGEDYDTPWAFLRDKYDADADGRIDRDEYTRDDDAFDRLDQDFDGVITEDDLARSSRQGMGSMIASMTLRTYFQDDDVEDLARTEVEARFTAMDTDGDDRLSSEEFDRGVEAARTAGPGTGPMAGGPMGTMSMDRFGMLANLADADGDQLLSRAELLAYFDQIDTDGDGVLAQAAPGGRDAGGGRRGRGPRSDRSGRRGDRGAEPEDVEIDETPSAVGRIAPDFTLKPYHGEGEPVTLSSFAGKTPVALIFGSYT